MLCPEPQRNRDLALKKLQEFDEIRTTGAKSDFEVLWSIEENYGKALFLVSDLCHYLHVDRLHIWHQHYFVALMDGRKDKVQLDQERAVGNAIAAIGFEISDTFPELSQLYIDIAKQAIAVEIPVLDPSPAIYEQLLQRVPAARQIDSLLRYIAEFWDETIDPLALDDCLDQPPVVETKLIASKAPYTEASDIKVVVGTDAVQSDTTLILDSNAPDPIAALHDSLDYMLWRRGYGYEAIKALCATIAVDDEVEFLRHVGCEVNEEAAHEINRIVMQQNMLVTHNPFLHEGGKFHRLTLLSPARVNALQFLQNEPDLLDVREVTDIAEVTSKISNAIRLHGSIILVIPAHFLADEDIARRVQDLAVTGYPVVVVGDETEAVVSIAENTQLEVHYMPAMLDQ